MHAFFTMEKISIKQNKYTFPTHSLHISNRDNPIRNIWMIFWDYIVVVVLHRYDLEGKKNRKKGKKKRNKIKMKKKNEKKEKAWKNQVKRE